MEISNREVCQFGYTYDFALKTIDKWVPFPKELAGVILKVGEQRGNFPNNMIAVRYNPPYDSNPQVDAKVFNGKIQSISLESGVTITFHNHREGHYDMYQPLRALMCIEGDARYSNTHCILPRDKDVVGDVTYPRFLRYALTFRYVHSKQTSHLI